MFDLVAPAQETGLAWWPVAVVIVTLIVLNVVNNRVAPQTHYLLWAFGGSVLLLAIGLLDGNSWTDMGLGWSYLLPGFIWGAACIGLITAVYLVGSAFKRTRAAFHDERMSELTGSRMMFQALVEVPFGTVLLEEIAFRAVLLSMLIRRFGLVWGVVIGSVLFGLWHILPSIGTHEQNPALGSVVGEGRRGNILAIALSVLTTTLAGVLFAALRLLSGSVLAPMGFHWATNGLGYAFSWLLIRTRDRRREKHRREVRARRAWSASSDAEEAETRIRRSRMTAMGFTPYDDAQPEGAPIEAVADGHGRGSSGSGGLPDGCSAVAPRVRGRRIDARRPGPPDPGVRTPVVEVRRRQGAGDPRPVRHERHPVLPAPQRPHRRSAGPRLRPHAG